MDQGVAHPRSMFHWCQRAENSVKNSGMYTGLMVAHTEPVLQFLGCLSGWNLVIYLR